MVFKKQPQPDKIEQRAKAVQRKEQIKLFIEEVGLWNIRQQTLADQFGVSQQLISKDIHSIIKEFEPKNLKEIKVNLFLAYKRAIAKTQHIQSTGTKKEQLEAARTLAQLGKNFTEMLEAYGLKHKVAEKVEHSGKVEGITVNIVKPEERRKE